MLFNFIEKDLTTINFQSKHNGILQVIKTDDLLTLNFPADTPQEVKQIPELTSALGLSPQKVLKGKTDYLLVYSNQEEIESVKPDFNQLLKLDVRGIIITAPGDKVDFVSRFFGPAVGVNEDPVTGSAHTTLIPYWATELGKTRLQARQLSNRGGNLACEFLGERVNISGKAVLYMTAEIEI